MGRWKGNIKYGYRDVVINGEEDWKSGVAEQEWEGIGEVE